MIKRRKRIWGKSAKKERVKERKVFIIRKWNKMKRKKERKIERKKERKEEWMKEREEGIYY